MSIFMNNIRSSVFRRVRTISAPPSPFTGKAQVAGMNDQRWRFEFEYRPMRRETAYPLIGAIHDQRDGTGTFVAWDPDWLTPISGNSDSGLVNGANQTADYIDTDDWGADAFVVATGDYVYISTGSVYLAYKSVSSASANGSGQCRIYLDAPLRVSPPNNAGVYLAPDEGDAIGITARLTGYEISPVGPDGFYSIRISGEEVV